MKTKTQPNTSKPYANAKPFYPGGHSVFNKNRSNHQDKNLPVIEIPKPKS